MRKLIQYGWFLVVLMLVVSIYPSLVQAQQKIFTAEELATYNGKDGAKTYTSYEGKVYDVTDSTLWKLGMHFGLEAGKDLTADMDGAPHGGEVFASFTQLGVLEGFEQPAEPEVAVAEPEIAAIVAPTEQKKWYEGRIRFLDISVLGWSGIFLGIVFVLTFATCFAMPWAKLKLPWTGSRPGPDPLDGSQSHLTWSSIHKHFVWVTVILGIIHGILGFLQMFGIYL